MFSAISWTDFGKVDANLSSMPMTREMVAKPLMIILRLNSCATEIEYRP